MGRREEAHRLFRPGTVLQPESVVEFGSRTRGGGARVGTPYRVRGTDALRGLSASYPKFVFLPSTEPDFGPIEPLWRG
jgi:hypothetical protein